MNKLKYGVIGAGAIGAYYGAKLATNGEEVHFLFNSDYEHVLSNGLRVDSCNGDMFISADKIKAYKSTEHMPACDVIIIALKTTSNHLLKTILKPILHENSLVVMIQNGINVEEDLAVDFPNIAIAGGMGFICSNKIGSGHINHIDYGKVTLAPYNQAAREILPQVVSDFESAGIETPYLDSLKEARWRKLLWNIPYNGTCVALCTTTDKIMNCASTRELARDLMIEVMNGANAQNAGFTIIEDDVELMLSSTEKMTPYLPSMRLDFDAKRPMEIEYIYTKAIEQARVCGVEMPKTKMLRDMLEFIQAEY